ncbi:hydrogenase maturation protease [Actinocrinis puniceicyclus]|uniref:Hydrogenase maturation protease n=1 Tax=Actinocrinis puniceicyclus TaxID=977794 RepID=A0A8J8BAX2_9ACTN|nr:hydrogenase maturation protease [Actinocrinis puniceicyclus]MBS2961521.1 hydrogenase maturation protease [Actinocrinis puniceicyclus]
MSSSVPHAKPGGRAAAGAARAASPSIIVIGVGMKMRGDGGFGAAVIEALRAYPAVVDRVRLAACDGEPARMIDLWQGYRCALVLDAVRGGSERHGFVYRRELDPEVGDFGAQPGGTSHAVGLGAAARLAHVMDRLPGRLILYAVHGRDFRLGAPLSGPVAQAVPELAARIGREVLGALAAAAAGAGKPAKGG